MSDEPELHEKQVEYLEDKLGVNPGGVQTVANDTKRYFAERADEEDLTPDEMITAISAVKEHVEDAVLEAMGGDD